MSTPRRGEVWLASLDPTQGHEQAGTRPVLVVSVDAFQGSGSDLAIVLPITSSPRNYPTRIPVAPPEGGLTKPSFIIGEQPRTIAISTRLKKATGSVTPITMAKVESVLRKLMGL